MGLAASTLFKGLVSRILPQTNPDNGSVDVPTRLGRYGDLKVESGWPTDHLLADEGAYMVAAMAPGATALQNGIYAAFVATTASIVLANSDVAGGKRIYPKSLRLVPSVAGTSGTCLRYTLVLDNKDRTPTTISSGAGGTGPGSPGANTGYRVPVVCTNMDVNPNPVGVPYFTFGASGSTGPMTVPAAGSGARTIVANGMIKNSIPVVLDQYRLQFGAADIGGTFQGAAALAKIVEHCPAIVIGPGQFLLIYLWSTSNITAGNAFDDVALEWIEK